MARRARAEELPLTEAAWQRQVIELARLYGWKIHHGRPAMTGRGWRTPIQGHAGFPDLTMVRAGRLVFAELKAQQAPKPRPDQVEWLDALRTVPGVEVFTWRPSDLALVLATLDYQRAEVMA